MEHCTRGELLHNVHSFGEPIVNLMLSLTSSNPEVQFNALLCIYELLLYQYKVEVSIEKIQIENGLVKILEFTLVLDQRFCLVSLRIVEVLSRYS